jgi:hypothetical protein
MDAYVGAVVDIMFKRLNPVLLDLAVQLCDDDDILVAHDSTEVKGWKYGGCVVFLWYFVTVPAQKERRRRVKECMRRHFRGCAEFESVVFTDFWEKCLVLQNRYLSWKRLAIQGRHTRPWTPA